MKGLSNHINVIILKKDDKLFREFIINHEIVHIFIKEKYHTIKVNFEPLISYFFKCGCLSTALLFAWDAVYQTTAHYNPSFRSILNLITFFIFTLSLSQFIYTIITLFLSHRQRYYARLEELFCDAKGVTYGSQEEQIETIGQGISFFGQTEILTLKMKLKLLLFGNTHPSYKIRIAQLKKIQKWIKKGQTGKLAAHLHIQEERLKNYFESFLTDPKKWISVRWALLKNRYERVRTSIRA